MLSLGEAEATEVMKHMGAKDVQRIGAAMTQLQNISRQEVQGVLAEFTSKLEEQTALGIGVDDYLRKVLIGALGEDKAGGVIDRILFWLQRRPGPGFTDRRRRPGFRRDALADIAKAGTIKVGIFEDFPPFASLGTDMALEGYDVEMAEIIAESLGVKAELVGITGQNRIPSLDEGKVDMLLSIGFSDERAKVVDFADPYAPYYIAVMRPGRCRGRQRCRPRGQDHRRQPRHARRH